MISLSLFSLRSMDHSLSAWFNRIFKTLLWILPFHVFLSVFAEYKLGISGFTLYKEVLLVIMAGILGILWYKNQLKYKFDVLDILILSYIGYLSFVTLWYPHPIEHLFYGGRYDFEFFIAFMIVRIGAQFLREWVAAYLRIFLISASAALALGIFIRWITGETILLHFGFSPNLSNWAFWGSIPIYHGIDGANVRRFQGIFDGPNPAGFFILLYLGVLVSYFRSAKKYYYLLSLWGIILIGVIFYTYSRSALIGLIMGLVSVGFILSRILWLKHRTILLAIIPVLFVIGGLFFLKFEDTIHNIVLREGSTKGHFDRSMIGIKRAIDRPLWSGLASSWPAYRFVKQPEVGESLFEWENKIAEDYYIPESWYIQQMVEGGIIGFVLFVSILGMIAYRLVRKNIFIFGSFIAMATMNLFLHSYESLYISLLLFMIVALVLEAPKKTAPHA